MQDPSTAVTRPPKLNDPTVGREENKPPNTHPPNIPPTIPTKMLTKRLLALPINCPPR